MATTQEERPAPRRRILVIHNPVAGYWQRNRLRRFLTALREDGAAVSVRPTRAAGDATRLAAAVDSTAYDAIVAAGGDGTIREVANGMAGVALPLGILPLGTANVLALELALGRDPDKAARAVLNGPAVPVFPGLCNQQRFLLMVSAGIDARVVERVSGRLKRILGKMAYVVAAVAEIFAGSKAGRVWVEADGERVEAWLIIVTRVRRYAGPFIVAPEAALTERGLWVVAPTGEGIFNIMRYAFALTTGRLAALPNVVVRQAREVTFLGPDGHPLQIDGDGAGTVPVTVTCADAPLYLIHPADGPGV